MNICFVYKEDYPWDVRVEKIVMSLARSGHDVTVVARNLKHLPQRDNSQGFAIRRLPSFSRMGRLGATLSAPLFFSPVWFTVLSNVIRETKSTIIVVRDLPLMPLAIMAGKVHRCHVIFDMAECYPEMYRSILEYSPHTLRSWFLKNPTLASFLERFSVHRSSHTFVMIAESRDRLIRLGHDPTRITIVSNTPGRPTRPPRSHVAHSRLRLLYVGFITRIRGLDNMIRGIRYYLDNNPSGPDVEFDAVGKGNAIPEYEALAEKLGLASRVRFHGWSEQSLIDELYAASDIGVLTYRVCAHWNHTIPNKLFDYMRVGMPVLATNVLPIQRIVEEVGCGMVCQDGNAGSCGEALAALVDPAARNELGRNGYDAVRRQYNWETDEARLLQVITQLQ